MRLRRRLEFITKHLIYQVNSHGSGYVAAFCSLLCRGVKGGGWRWGGEKRGGGKLQNVSQTGSIRGLTVDGNSPNWATHVQKNVKLGTRSKG